MEAAKEHNGWATDMYVIRNWEGNYENNRSRAMIRAHWFPMSNDIAGDAYTQIVDHEDGAAHLGVWCALRMVASKSPERGCMLRDNKTPHDSKSLSRALRIPEALISATISRLIELELIDEVKAREINEHAVVQQGSASPRQESAFTGSTGSTPPPREQKHRKGKRRTEVLSTAPLSGPKPPSWNTLVGGGEKPGTEYATAIDELKAIHLAKAGEPITTNALDKICSILASRGVDTDTFLEADVRPRLAGEWNNPTGLLLHLARDSQGKQLNASAPVTAAEAADRNYKCPLCGSRTRGEGARLGADGKTCVACSCASPEYVAAHGLATEDAA